MLRRALEPLELALLALLVVVPVAFMWHFASSSYFFWDDFPLFYEARHSGALLPYLFQESGVGHLAPGHRLGYLALDRVAPMDFDVALASLLAFHAVSVVLLQRILTLLFGRAWWTYALAIAWAISVVYVPAFSWLAAGMLSIPAITATLASIHAYLHWRAGGRQAWLAWSLVAMTIGIAFYIKVLLVPVYLLLMRVLLLDPDQGLRDSLRSVRGEWRVWVAYATVCVVYLLVFVLGDYGLARDGTVGDIADYLRTLWFEGFAPTVFGARVSGQGEWHWIVFVAAQVALLALVVWSVTRRRTAWRAWVFLLVSVAANALMLVGRAPWEETGNIVRYYTEFPLLVALAVAFAFATPRLRAHTAEPVAPRARPMPTAENKLVLPRARTGVVALVLLAVYCGVTWASAGNLPNDESGVGKGRLARAYLENLRGDLAVARRAGVQPSLLDQDVPEPVVVGVINLIPGITGDVRASLLSSVVPLFDGRVTFNRPGDLYVVRPDGHLERTRFVPAAGGSPAELQRTGRLSLNEAHAERRDGEWCVIPEGLSALEWEPRPHLRGRDWGLRVRYRTEPVEPFWLDANNGVDWVRQEELPPMESPGTAIASLGELPEGVPTNAGVRIGIPPFGRLCLSSLEIGYLDPAAPTPTG